MVERSGVDLPPPTSQLQLLGGRPMRPLYVWWFILWVWLVFCVVPSFVGLWWTCVYVSVRGVSLRWCVLVAVGCGGIMSRLLRHRDATVDGIRNAACHTACGGHRLLGGW
jgi:hypothetical protein